MIAPDWALFARPGMERARLMRWVLCAVVVLAFAPGAYADDLDILRGPQSLGPPAFTRWSGFYFGGQAAYGQGHANFSNATQGGLANAIGVTSLALVVAPSSLSLLGDTTDTVSSYGGFVGFNSQWEDLVIGGEIDYSRVNMNFNAPSTPVSGINVDTQNSTFQQETQYSINGSATGELRLIDYASLRARAGWILGDNFLPYGFGGFVLGRGSYSDSFRVSGMSATTGQITVPTLAGPITYIPAPAVSICGLPAAVAIGEICQPIGAAGSSGSGYEVMYGFDAGLGVDIALAPNVFVRGEFEYVHFFPIQYITLDIVQARVGAGFKF